MIKDVFFLDGVSCEDYGITLQGPIEFSGSIPNVTAVSIPGRNGDLHISDGSYGNVTGIAGCFVLSKSGVEDLHTAAGWLMGDGGYRRLEVGENASFFRLARVSRGPEDAVRAGLLAPFDVTFDCDPRVFLTSGEEMAEYSGPTIVTNPTRFPAKPLIKVYGIGPGDLTIGNVKVEILELEDQITLDCETQNAYRQPGEGGIENKNNTISAPVFPELLPGENAVSWTGDISAVQITPRWWTL